MIVRKLTRRAQATVPLRARTTLRFKSGDELVWEIKNGRIVFSKATHAGKTDDPFHAFTEWRTEADAAAYADL